MHTAAASTALMNRIYRRQRHVYDATRKYYLLGRDDLIDRLDARPGDAVLEIGCGTGRNLIIAAQRYPQAKFYGIDVSTAMLTTAIDHLARAGLANRVRVAHADATAFEPGALFGQRRFARVFVSYSLSMIPAWEQVIDQAIALLAPGGELHIVDFGDQRGLPRLFRRGLRRWLAAFHVTPRDDLEPLLALHAIAQGAHFSLERPYRGYAQAAVLRQPAAA